MAGWNVMTTPLPAMRNSSLAVMRINPPTLGVSLADRLAHGHVYSCRTLKNIVSNDDSSNLSGAVKQEPCHLPRPQSFENHRSELVENIIALGYRG